MRDKMRLDGRTRVLERELEEAYDRIEELENHIRDGATLISGDEVDDAWDENESES